MFKTKKDVEELKEIKLSHEELAVLRKRNEALAVLKYENYQLEEKRSELDKQIMHRRIQIDKEQQFLDKFTLIKIHSSLLKIPDGLSIADKETADLLLILLKLIHEKFAIKKIWGQFNLLNNDSVSISFSKDKYMNYSN